MWMGICILCVFYQQLQGVYGQPPIPSTYPGHAMGTPGAPILFEIFYDHLCPDSKASWPVIQQVVNAYLKNNSMYFICHIYPLPYHRNTFYTTQAGLVLEAATDVTTWFQWLDLLFAKQDEFYTPTTNNATGNQIIQDLEKLAVPLGVSKINFRNGMQYGNDFDESARVNWKYGTTRGIYGTPEFYINGIFATDDPTWTYAQWTQLIDSLLP